MKHHRVTLAIAALVLASLACRAVMGGGSPDVDADPVPVTESTVEMQDLPATESLEEAPEEGSTGDSDSTASSQFPMTPDAYNIVEGEDGSLIYYTKLSSEEAMQFYRDEYLSQGYTEREDLTIVLDGMFSMVFDGDPSGKSVVIQSVDLGDGNRTISVRLEDV